MRIAQVFLGGSHHVFNHEYTSEEDARRAIAFTRVRGELWMLESEVKTFGTEPVRGRPCGTGWF